MITNHTVASLRAFEESIASAFNAGEIPHPVHLSHGNEQQLIDIFQGVQPQDWLCVSWRSHYHCLLKGVPEDELRQAVRSGRSITLCFPEHRIVSSAIVGGAIPIALGLAWAEKRKPSGAKVWCFVGDMTAETGAHWEAASYAHGHGLPLQVVIEDNGRSVLTDTQNVWASAGVDDRFPAPIRYKYDLSARWPHAGAGKRVEF